jgi:large subunit ribosomal protein L29
MKAKEFKDMTAADINKKIAELKTELFNLRFQHATNQLDNPIRIAEVKKDIARAKTVLREMEIKAQAQR